MFLWFPIVSTLLSDPNDTLQLGRGWYHFQHQVSCIWTARRRLFGFNLMSLSAMCGVFEDLTQNVSWVAYIGSLIRCRLLYPGDHIFCVLNLLCMNFEHVIKDIPFNTFWLLPAAAEDLELRSIHLIWVTFIISFNTTRAILLWWSPFVILNLDVFAILSTRYQSSLHQVDLCDQ